jgi:predicted transcriptional regulator
MNVQATRTIELPAEVYEDLAAFASAHDLTVAEVVREALYALANPVPDDVLDDIDRAIEEADAGDFISHDVVVEWLMSWGTPNEKPPPRHE